MSSSKRISWNTHTHQLNVNQLSGRVLDLPANNKKAKRQILLVYGHHASIERMHGLVEELSKYGDVTLPDLPGFGGMDSFFKIQELPSTEKLADYLASFVKMRYKRRRITVIGMSYGFAVITKMLQKYPEIESKVDLAVSLVGFVHHEDFKMSRRMKSLLLTSSRLLSYKIPSLLARYVLLNRFAIRTAYRLQRNSNSKIKHADNKEVNARIAFEIKLWQCNDVRTYSYTGKEMLTLNLCEQQPLHIPAIHVRANYDRYFDFSVVEQHLNITYKTVTFTTSKLDNHAPTVIADAKEAAPFIPKKLRTALKKL